MRPDVFSRRRLLLGAGASVLLVRPVRAEAVREFSVREFGARGDGAAIDTGAVNRAIEAAASAGGGTVRFAAGTYRCHSIRLKSKVGLYLENGATILAAEPSANAGYDAAEPNEWSKFQDFGHSHWHNSLIWGEGLSDIQIAGPGMIDGKGLTTGSRAEAAGVGDKAIALKNCQHVTLRDFSILRGGHFGVLATGVDNFTVDNLLIDTNRDGINLDCCRNARVSNCSINSPGDDAICLKSSLALGAARATEMVTIANCMVSGGWAIGSLLDGSFQSIPVEKRHSRSGRIKFGTESNGGFKSITISNVVFDGCGGLALEMVNGGVLEDVMVTNLTMRDISNSPIFLRLGRRGAETDPVGKLRRVIISNITCSNSFSRYGSIVSGIPGHAIEGVKIRDVYIQHQGGGTREMAALEPAENEAKYPDPPMFGDLPSHGFFLRHVKDLEISNVEIEPMQPDLRPVFWVDDVEDVALYRVKAPRVAGTPAFALRNVRNLSVSASAPLLKDTLVDRAEPIKL